MGTTISLLLLFARVPLFVSRCNRSTYAKFKLSIRKAIYLLEQVLGAALSLLTYGC